MRDIPFQRSIYHASADFAHWRMTHRSPGVGGYGFRGPRACPWGSILGVFLIIFLFIRPGLAQTSDELKNLRKEMESLKENQKAIQKDLQEIKSILRARGLLEEDPQNLFIDLSGKPFKGDKNAKLILIEFSEYE
jgi:hypothetical protein